MLRRDPLPLGHEDRAGFVSREKFVTAARSTASGSDGHRTHPPARPAGVIRGPPTWHQSLHNHRTHRPATTAPAVAPLPRRNDTLLRICGYRKGGQGRNVAPIQDENFTHDRCPLNSRCRSRSGSLFRKSWVTHESVMFLNRNSARASPPATAQTPFSPNSDCETLDTHDKSAL